MNDLRFFVIVDKNTGLFLKKTGRMGYAYGFWTDKIGQARIFSSKARAEIGYNLKDKKANYSVVGYYATEYRD